MNFTLAREHEVAFPAPRSKLLPCLLLFATLGLLWFILCRDLSLEWSSNEQYSYGWFVPFFAAFLFWLRLEESGKLTAENGNWSAADKGESSRNAAALGEAGLSKVKVERAPKADRRKLTTDTDVTARFAREQQSNFSFVISAFSFLFLLLPIRLFEVANPDWRPLSWLHALIVVGLTLLVVGYWGGKAAVRHFAFPVCFILVAVPWITPIEGPIVQGLMRLVATVATETLTLLGIPAQLEGSLIRVDNGVVGVSEACSGVRSLQTSLMIGLLFGELKRLTIWRRVALVAAALAIALFANFGRALFLVWIAATQNLAAVERWHDIAGYAIVGAVFLGTIAIAAAIGQTPGSARDSRALAGASPDSSAEREVRSQKEGRSSAEPTSVLRPLASNLRLPSSIFLLSTFAFLLFTEASVSAWYRWHERDFVETTRWSVRWPETAPKFHPIPIDDNVRSTLGYDSGREGAWQTILPTPPDQQPAPATVMMFFLRWEPGSTSIMRARAHRPDICLPSTGWRMAKDEGVRWYEATSGFSLPFRHFSFVREAAPGRQIFAHAFFCQREDRVPSRVADRFDITAGAIGDWMFNDRVRAVREGLRNQGQQVMQLVLLSQHELSAKEAQTEFAALVRGLVKEEK